MRIVFSFALIVAATQAFAPMAPGVTRSSDATALHAMNRRQVLMEAGIAASVASLVISTPAAYAAENILPNGVVYKVNKKGDGAQPTKGELCAIRFKASTEDGRIIDDIFDTPEPYYTRVGLGGMLSGVEGALPYMHVGDRWTLSIPPALAFGAKGRPASAGKPRIAGDTTIIFEVEMVGLPGKEPELIELIGD